MIAALFAIDENGGMGLNGTMPWPRNKDDLSWFKKTTLNQVVVMGRNTWNSEDMPSPLPKRVNAVFTNNTIPDPSVIQLSGDVCEQLQYVQKLFPDLDIYVIGGADILMKSLPVIEKMYITRLDGDYDCDVIINIDHVLSGFTLVNSSIMTSCAIEEYIK